MKITPSKIKKFLEKPDILNGVFLHGSDINIINFFVHEIISILGEYSVQVMDFITVNKSPDLLLSELANIPMFANKKLIKLINVSGGISKELENILYHHVNNNYIMMVASDYSAATKSCMEGSKNFGVIACYKDSNSNNLYEIISNFFKKNDLKYTSGVIYRLQSYFSHSKLHIYSELEKLILYIGERKNLKLADVELYLSASSNDNDYVTLDRLCSAVANKDIINFVKISDTLILHENFSPISLIRIISNYFIRLEKVLLLTQNGISEKVAIDQLAPPLLFKQLQNFKLHLKNFQLLELRKMLEELLRLEVICKKTDLDQKMIFQHGLQMAYT